MWIIYRYVFYELIPPFFASLGVMTLILMLARIFKLMEMIITKGISVLIVGELFVYYLPAILVMTIPMSILVSTLIAFGRLSEDNEITAMKACGISLFKTLIPAVIFAILMSSLLVYFYDTVLPFTNHRFKNLLLDIGMKRPDLNIEEGVMVDDFPGYQILIQEIDEKTGDMSNITILKYDGGRISDIIIAEEGSMSSNIQQTEEGDVITMTLYNGEIHEMNPSNPETYRQLKFRKQIVNLYSDTELVRRDRDYRTEMELSTKEIRLRLKKITEAIEEIKTREYVHPMPGTEERKKKQIENFVKIRNTYLVEIYKKYSIPFASIAFVLMGAPFGMIVRRSGKGVGLGVSIILFLIYYLFMVGGKALGTKNIIPPLLAVWLPNIIFAGLGSYLLYRTIIGTPRLKLKFIDRIKDYFKKRKKTDEDNR